MKTASSDVRTPRQALRIALILVAIALAAPLIAQTPPPDLCGCRNAPGSLGAFDTRDKNTWPPGSAVVGADLVLPVPADGVMVFDSIHIEYTNPPINWTCCIVEVGFQHNAANTPLTLLVKGDVFIASNGIMQVRGATGSNGTQDQFGAGGLGGAAGFRGGDGAYVLGNLANDGAVALGPGGGIGATASPQTGAGGGTFVGAVDLLPLVGGSGGGGGRSTTPGTNCSGGGGGGGGGAILIAANGTITINSNNGGIIADGGNGGAASGFPCASGGAGGAGGAIRLIANTINGTGRMFARAGRRWEDNQQAGAGVIRMEALSNSFNVSFADPIASRSGTPGPLVNPFSPDVIVTAVNGQAVPAPPQGVFGAVDIQVPRPGPTAIDLATDGVPAGTTVEVKVKPRAGSGAIAQTVTLVNCDGSGRCLASATIDLAAGTYAVEARATFQSPGP